MNLRATALHLHDLNTIRHLNLNLKKEDTFIQSLLYCFFFCWHLMFPLADMLRALNVFLHQRLLKAGSFIFI